MLNTIAAASLIFFHRGDHIPAYEFTHYPCVIEPLYISGLDETKTYLHSNGFYLYEDRVIFHLNPRITRFEIRNNDDNSLVDEIHIRWKTDCDPRLTTAITTSTTPNNTNSRTFATSTSLGVITTNSTASTSKVSVEKNKNINQTTNTATSSNHTNYVSSQTEKAVIKNLPKKLHLDGVDKQQVYINEPFNLLQNVYLRDEVGNDHSHRLSHSQFTNDREGVFIVEVSGKVDESTIKSLMEVEVIQRKAAPAKQSKSFQTYFFMITSFILGGFIALWYHIRK